MDTFKDFNPQEYTEYLLSLVYQYAPKLALAILTLVIGLWFIRGFQRLIKKVLNKKNIDASLAPFLNSVIGIALRVLLFVSVISMVGIEMTSFVAIIGAAGLAVGLALQGTLQNFAGGVILLLLKPFKVGDVVEAKGFLGIVKEIQIFYTIINTFDKKVIYIPNGGLANAEMTNYSAEDLRRNEWKFGIAYGDDVDKAKEVLQKLIDEDSRIIKDQEDIMPFIAVHSLGDSSVNMVVRAWSSAADLWPVNFDMNENVYKEFPKNGLNIPFPQMDVHVHNKK